MKIDAEKGEGIDLAEEYAIRGYPTTVFVNSSGEEIDRIIGYLPIDNFLAEVQRIDRGENTYISLQQEVAEDSTDVETLIQFAGKVEDRVQYSERTLDLWERIEQLASDNTDYAMLADYKVASHQSMVAQSPEPLTRYIANNNENSYRLEAYSDLVQLYRSTRDSSREASTFRTMVNEAMESDQASPSMLNSYAWRMASLERNLDDALEKARLAVEMVPNDDAATRAQIMDTEAEVLWKLGRTEEAIEVINQCIELQPDDPYYQEQKTKFQGVTV